MVQIGNIKLGDFPLLLAPMEDVSDPPFRVLCKEQGADLMFTEFISSEGLIRDAAKSVKKLDFYEKERPLGIQIFGAVLDSMLQATEIVCASQPDILDINYGCPVKKVVNKNAGAGILRDIPLMVKLTAEVVKRSTLPVTVKTRLGWDHNSSAISEVAERLQDVGIQAISIHGRTRVQMYKGTANWEPIIALKKNPRLHIPVFVNGDINTPEKAQFLKDCGVDGIMIGRASIGNPWIFNQIKHYLQKREELPKPNLIQKVAAAKRHLEMAIAWKGERLGVLETRRHYSNYFKGIPNFKKYRLKLVTADLSDEVYSTFDDLLKNFTQFEMV